MLKKVMGLFQTVKHRPVRVLFVCLGNVFRSRMAEAFAQARGSGLIEARSAGLAPARQSSRTARLLMREKGIVISDAQPKKIVVSELASYDLIVNVCEYGLPRTSVQVLKAAFPDPARKGPQEQREIRDSIELFVDRLIAHFREARQDLAA